MFGIDGSTEVGNTHNNCWNILRKTLVWSIRDLMLNTSLISAPEKNAVGLEIKQTTTSFFLKFLKYSLNTILLFWKVHKLLPKPEGVNNSADFFLTLYTFSTLWKHLMGGEMKLRRGILLTNTLCINKWLMLTLLMHCCATLSIYYAFHFKHLLSHVYGVVFYIFCLCSYL